MNSSNDKYNSFKYDVDNSTQTDYMNNANYKSQNSNNHKEKKRNKLNINLKKMVLIIYIIAIVFQGFIYIPYTKYEIYVSRQNVPHEVAIFTRYYCIGDEPVSYDEYAYRVNYKQIAIQLTVTTLIAGAVMGYVYTKPKKSK